MNRQRLQNKGAQPTVVGTGLLALDVVFSVGDASAVGTWAGGTLGNVMIILSYLGWDAFPLARLNKNYDSEAVLEDLGSWDVHDDFVFQAEHGSTPIIIEHIKGSGRGEAVHRFSSRCPACGGRLPGYRPMTDKQAKELIPRLPKPKVFFFDRVSRSSINLAKWSKREGAVVVFEPSGVGDPKLFREALEIAHVVKYSAERLSRKDFPSRVEKPLLLIETRGKQGLRFQSRLVNAGISRWREVGAFAVDKANDAAGAGDWCTAGVIDQVARGGIAGLTQVGEKRLLSAFKFGQAVAAWNCLFPGARGGMYQVSREAFEQQVKQLLGQTKKAKSPNIVSRGTIRQARANNHFCYDCR